MLSRENLKGIFAAVPIPWNEDYTFDEATFRDDLARLCDAGVHGIYTTGTSGEFYSLDFDEFKHLVSVFAEETRDRKVLTQVGCLALNSRDAGRMAQYAASKGVDGIQVALPFWMPLSDREMIQFFRDMAEAAGGLPLIHYNTSRSKRFLGVRDYQMLLNEVPSLLGTKFTSSDLMALTRLVMEVPELEHFVTETLLVPGMMVGARGCYSSLVLMNPRLIMHVYQLCTGGEWAAAVEWHRKMMRLLTVASNPLRATGCVDAAIDKARAAASGFLKCPLRVRKPYIEATEEQVQEFRVYLKKHLPEFLDLGPQAPQS